MKVKNIWASFILLCMSMVLVLFFQNCAGNKMDFASTDRASFISQYGASEFFATNEDTALLAKPTMTLVKYTGLPSAFSIASQSTYGVVSDFNPQDGSFKYMPNAGYFGEDSFEYSELSTSSVAKNAVNRRISITVKRVDHQPWLANQTFNLGMNTSNNALSLIGKDENDPNPKVVLDLTGKVTQLATQQGGLVKQVSPGNFTYTPPVNFRGIDKINVMIVNEAGLSSQGSAIVSLGNPFMNLEPALAVRGPACLNCHANVTSRFITDLGYGDSYFFGTPSNPFASQGGAGAAYGDHAKSWATSTFGSDIIVPKGNIGLNLVQLAADAKALNGVDVSGVENTATTIAAYISAIEGKKAKPAKVIENASVYIAAPTADLLNTRTGGTQGAAYKFYKDNADVSPNLSGLIDRGAYLEANNTGLTCDGDLIISKPLYLNNLVLNTSNGCRIYSTQAIFVQGAITYNKTNTDAANNTNLQLVSTQWVNLGVGDSHCENPTTNPGWYSQNATAMGYKPDEFRLLTYQAPTRAYPLSVDAQTFDKTLLTELRSIPSFKDASCEASVAGAPPRQVHFERLLINAPRVDSRYTGQFTGVVVSEFTMMSLSKFSFTYDTVFNRVPVLPLMKAEDFLVVK